MVKAIWLAAMTLLSVTLLASCGKNELTWTEDVKLPDGRVITLKRWVEFKGGSSHLGDPSTESQQTFEFKNPDTGELIKWHNALEQARLETLALWMGRDKPVLLTKPAYGGDSRKAGCPNPPYLLYEYTAGLWKNKPLAEISIKKIRVNLTFSPLERREYIQSRKYHLTDEETGQSSTYVDGTGLVPYLIQFEGMPKQIFKEENCDRSFNYLIHRGEN